MLAGTTTNLSRPSDPWKRAAISAIGVLVLTSVHHVYGAIIYQTPIRLNALLVAVPVAMLIAALLTLGFRCRGSLRGRVGTFSGLTLAFLVSVVMFGMYEGFYNHVMKDILYFAGLSESQMMRLFPPPTYEMPNDWIFEITGVLQFGAGLLAARDGFKLLRQKL